MKHHHLSAALIETSRRIDEINRPLRASILWQLRSRRNGIARLPPLARVVGADGASIDASVTRGAVVARRPSNLVGDEGVASADSDLS